MMIRSKPVRAILLLLLTVVEAVGISQAWQAYRLQASGVFKISPWISMAGNALFILFLVAGCIGWYLLFFPTAPHTPQVKTDRRIWGRIVAVGGLFALALVFIHTTPLRILLASWLTPIWLMGWLICVKVAVSLDFRKIFARLELSDFLFALAGFVLIKSLQEFKLAAPLENSWRIGYYLFLLFQALVLTGIWSIKNTRVDSITAQSLWIAWRDKSRVLWAIIGCALLVFLPITLFWLDKENVATGAFFRLEWMLLAAFFIALGFERSSKKAITFPMVVCAFTVAGFSVMTGAYLSRVTDYPFSLYWSEGNRFYDYSLIFGKSIYQYAGELQPNYFSPGRYGLWGLPFLIPGLPIWAHRLWNAILYLVPGLVLGGLLGRGFSNKATRWACVFGVAIFFNQGPVYPTLTISLILALVGIHSKMGWRLLAALLASVFAGLSRFTWVLAIAAFVGLLDLLIHYPKRTGTWIQRLLPTAVMILAGLLPGMAVSWPEVFASQGEMIQSQALLWYRLWPNSTYQHGILLGFILATGSMLLLVLSWISSKTLRFDFWQTSAVFVTIFGLLVAGLVASVKIGGGSNLHNLDMYFAVLILPFIFGLHQTEQNQRPFAIPRLDAILLGLAILLPVFSVTWSGKPLVLPKPDLTRMTLNEIKKEVAAKSSIGEVLFIDQRQLITFGEITNLPLLPEYEKKYMMDKAMAGDEVYFADFYRDLKDKRFVLIVSEPLNISEKTNVDDFSEENNAWVQHITIPVYEHYEAIYTDKKNNIQLFIPR